ncbi:2776_t:CDS:2, partial [Dentiscutata heterogama]
MKFFLIFLCLFIISTKSQNTNSNYTTFNYTESTSGTAFPHSQPLVLNVNTYDDGTILVLIARAQNDSVQDNSCSGLKLEPTLRIRIIKVDGTVIEINYRYILDPLNFCIINDTSGNQLVPITVYALYEPFFLVNYVKAANSSDPTTYEEWGQVIDWDGKNRSEIHYGSSHINHNNSWDPQSAIQLNVNKKRGFLRLGTTRNSNFKWNLWQQYSIDDFGTLSLLQNSSISIVPIDSISSQSTIMPTIDGGYAVLSVNSSDNNGNDSLLATRGGLYATFLSYNQSIPSTQALLYQFTFPNISFNGLYCDVAPKGIGYRCLIAVRANNSELDYIIVNFLTSESVVSVGIMPNNITGLPSWGMQAMPLGGYILYTVLNNNYYIYPFDSADNPLNPLGPFIANSFATNFIVDGYNPNNLNAANSIMKSNNTFILASPETNDEKSSWSLLIIKLPNVFKDSGYGNLQITQIFPPVHSTVDSSTTTLNITFNNTVVPSIGSISIYKSSDHSLRQSFQAISNDFVKLMDDNKTVNIKIIGSTFNQFNETYYLQMDANFVKDEQLYEPLTGIDEGIVAYTS